MAAVLPLTVCPEPGCNQVAEEISRWWSASTSGRVLHVRTQCINGHVLTHLPDDPRDQS